MVILGLISCTNKSGKWSVSHIVPLMVELQKKNKCLIYLRQHEKQTEFTLKKTEQTKDFYYTKVFEKAQIKLQYILL